MFFRSAVFAAALVATVLPGFAAEFGETSQGQISFLMPSSNVGCIYTPEGGTDVYEPAGGGPELSCDRVEPSYVRVVLSRSGKATRYNDVADASCCGGDEFDYGEVWSFDGFRCASSETGLTCRRGGHGFSLSRKAIKTW